MPLIAPHTPEPFHFRSPQQALAHIQILHKHGKFQRIMEAVIEVTRSFPNDAQPFLVLAHDLLMACPDRSRYTLYQARTFDFPIAPGDKVLDMGSGHCPFPLATHLADIALTDGHVGRAGIPFKHVDGKPVFECSVEETPFADKEFDFVYCSHVLEHVRSPRKACMELMRIAKRGYIETPTKGKDIFLHSSGVSNHTQQVELVDNVLTFHPYTEWETEGIGHDILLKMHCKPQSDREKAFSALIYLYPRAINTMLLWKESFEFRECDT